jgi:hypothetical protein
MFAVGTWVDRVRVPPSHLGSAAELAALTGPVPPSVVDYLTRELDATYANRVIPGIGLALSLWSNDAVKESLILPVDGGMLPSGALAVRARAAPAHSRSGLTAFPRLPRRRGTPRARASLIPRARAPAPPRPAPLTPSFREQSSSACCSSGPSAATSSRAPCTLRASSMASRSRRSS